jgi:hypothetical protein
MAFQRKTAVKFDVGLPILASSNILKIAKWTRASYRSMGSRLSIGNFSSERDHIIGIRLVPSLIPENCHKHPRRVF